MKRIQALVFVLLIVTASSGLCDALSKKNTVYQVSTITALKQGRYDGSVTFGELKQYGDFGLGTFQSLDGEMVAVDGQFYQVRVDGTVHKVPDSATTPFANVCFFHSERRIVLLKNDNFEKLKEALDSMLMPKEEIHAIRIRGLFPYVKTRSVPAQQKPYPGLAEVIKQQKVFELRNVRGTLVGFRFPKSMSGLNVTGYHFHFLTDDKQAGGHVLECSAKNPNVETALFTELYMTFSAVKSKAQRSLIKMPQKLLKSLKAVPGKAQ